MYRKQKLFVFHPATYRKQLSEVTIYTEHYCYSAEYLGNSVYITTTD